MSLRFRAAASAVLLGLGLLMMVGGSVDKSSERIRHQVDLQKHREIPREPSMVLGNILLILGAILSAAGAGALVFCFRELTRDIREAQARAEAAMRMEVAAKPPPKPK